MKTSHVLASLFFGSLAAAAPFDRRALVTHTEVVVETVVVYTTVYDDEPVTEATTTAAASSYQEITTSAEALPTTTATPTSTPTPTPTPAYTPSVQQQSSSTYVAQESSTTYVAQESSSTYVAQESSSTYVAPIVQELSSIFTPPVVVTPTPTPTPTPEPVTTSVAAVSSAPAPAVSSVVPQATSETTETPSSGNTESSGEVYSGDITIYHTEGGSGACGTQLSDTDFVVALAKPAWGASTYDVMTGAATNPWCGQKIKVNYNGKSVEATIMDMCPGCVGHDVDLSLAAWNALGMTELTRIQGTWSKVN